MFVKTKWNASEKIRVFVASNFSNFLQNIYWLFLKIDLGEFEYMNMIQNLCFVWKIGFGGLLYLHFLMGQNKFWRLTKVSRSVSRKTVSTLFMRNSWNGLTRNKWNAKKLAKLLLRFKFLKFIHVIYSNKKNTVRVFVKIMKSKGIRWHIFKKLSPILSS